jgi:hypothetical protein
MTKQRCGAISNAHCEYAIGGMDLDADRLNETLETCIQAAKKKQDRDIADWGECAPDVIYTRGLIDAYLDIRDRVFKTKDYETAHHRAIGAEKGAE